MGDHDALRCDDCGASAMAAFVQHGSYFTRCTNCRAEGPATSWLALRNHLQGNFKAVAVGRDFEPVSVVAQGEVSQIAEAISKAAGEGQLVRLLAEAQSVQQSRTDGLMTADELSSKFWTLCDRVDAADTVESGVPDLEPFLLELLAFIKAHPDHRQLFCRQFERLVDGSAPKSRWIVLFCMRDLRWPEIQEAANRRFVDAGGVRAPRLMNWISDINWAYVDEPWDKADFFRYFWEKEHPGEPWPCEPRA